MRECVEADSGTEQSHPLFHALLLLLSAEVTQSASSLPPLLPPCCLSGGHCSSLEILTLP